MKHSEQMVEKDVTHMETDHIVEWNLFKMVNLDIHDWEKTLMISMAHIRIKQFDLFRTY